MLVRFLVTTRPVPWSRTIFGRPSKAQNITVMPPFSRKWAIVSLPLPVTLSQAKVYGEPSEGGKPAYIDDRQYEGIIGT